MYDNSRHSCCSPLRRTPFKTAASFASETRAVRPGRLLEATPIHAKPKVQKCRKSLTSLALDGSVPLIVGKLAERSALRWVMVVMVAAWRDWQDQPDYFMDLHQATEPARRSTYAMCATDTSSVRLLSYALHTTVARTLASCVNDWHLEHHLR